MSRLDGNAYFVVIGLALLPILLGANTRTNFDHADIVDYVEGEKLGILEVKLIPKDASRATVVLKNHSQKPIRVQLPSAFAGVPVLGQADDFGAPLGDDGFGAGGLQGQQTQGNQTVGGGFGGGAGGGGGGFGGAGGLFDVAPKGVRKISVTTVCLEHGKKEPNPRISYSLRPIESFTDDARIHTLCRLIGAGRIEQKSAQALSWHLDGLSWQRLARKVKTKHLNGATEMYFNAKNLHVAQRALTAIRKHLSEREIPASLADSRSDRVQTSRSNTTNSIQ